MSQLIAFTIRIGDTDVRQDLCSFFYNSCFSFSTLFVSINSYTVYGRACAAKSYLISNTVLFWCFVLFNVGLFLGRHYCFVVRYLICDQSIVFTLRPKWKRSNWFLLLASHSIYQNTIFALPCSCTTTSNLISTSNYFQEVEIVCKLNGL